MPAYNVSGYISATLDSALSQTFKDFEIIVVDDGSPDFSNLQNVLAKYFDDIVFIRQENSGAAAARNTAISNARGSILAFLDGDDVWLPEKLSKQVEFLQNYGLEMVYCDALLFGDPQFDSKTFMQTSPSNGEVSPESLLNGTCNIITSGTIVKKERILEVGCFDENADRIEDFDLWFRLCKIRVKIGYQKEVMLKYRIRAGSLTGTSVEKNLRTIAAMNLVREKHKLSISEEFALNETIRASSAAMEAELGKRELIARNFAAAKEHFARSVSFVPSLKIKIINILLTTSPNIVLRLFKKFRPFEASGISSQKSHES